jgi:hypothetical protein
VRAPLARQEVPMAQSPKITIFNTSPRGIQLSVNKGPQFSVSGASAPDWSPQTSVVDVPPWSDRAPYANLLMPGVNSLEVTPAGADRPVVVRVHLPKIQWNSMQIYIFLDNYSNVSWIALNDGQCITGALSWGAD